MKITTLLCLIFTSSIVDAASYSCKNHNHTLTIKSVGYEHINHQVYINKKTLIKELIEEMWFIENITCTNTGFVITASHRQYHDSEQRIFNLIINNSKYELY